MRFIVLGVIVIFALVAGYASLQLAGQAPQQEVIPAQQTVNVVDVLVAKQPIPIGTVLNEDLVDKQPWPQHLLLEGFVVSGTPEANITGMVARSDLQAREPLIISKLGNPNDASFLAAALSKGMRAVTLSVDAISGVAGYVFPGDRVDVLVTHSAVTNDGAPNASEVLLSNIKVLATELRQTANTKSSNAPPSNLTIEVTADEAQKIRLAEKRGTLAIALRSLKDSDELANTDPTTLSELSKLRADQSPLQSSGVLIVRGTSMSAPVAGTFPTQAVMPAGNESRP